LTLESAFAVTATDTGFHGLVGEEWMFGGRVFGGCAAAFASQVVRAAAPQHVLAGIQGSYPRAASPGAIEGRVETVSQGRSSRLVRVDLIQRDQPVFTGHAWLLDPRLMPADHAEGAEPPESSPLVEWLADEVPFFKNLEIRAIDYPLTPAGLGDGVPRCEVWARARPESLGETTHESLVDLLLYDSFLLETVFRSEGLNAAQPVTLDLGVRWMRHTPRGAWRRLVTEAAVADDLALANGTSRTTGGTLLSMATTQGRLLRAAPNVSH
jgi:acyl-CoA thioesterase